MIGRHDRLKELESHFSFGKNWSSYAQLISDREIEEAKKGLLKLVSEDQIRGQSFLDIGCGSGIHSLAAAQLGADRILAVDIDPDSVNTTSALLERYNVSTPWCSQRLSVFDLDSANIGTFGIVYSWGVLHHTGSMWEAIEKAALIVQPNGLLIIALYRTTRMDWFWKQEKRWYANASPFAQGLARKCYIFLYWLIFRVVKRVNFSQYIANYKSMRGMDFLHDVHDWLGGYPYETTLASEVEQWMAKHGFVPQHVPAFPMTWGFLGSGCHEYVFRRRPN